MTKQVKNTEKVLEKRLFSELQKRKGHAIKFFSVFDTGWPDRFVLVPGGRFYLVELKTEGQKPTPIQESKHRWLIKNGFSFWLIDTDDKLNKFLKQVDDDLRTA